MGSASKDGKLQSKYSRNEGGLVTSFVHSATSFGAFFVTFHNATVQMCIFEHVLYIRSFFVPAFNEMDHSIRRRLLDMTFTSSGKRLNPSWKARSLLHNNLDKIRF